MAIELQSAHRGATTIPIVLSRDNDNSYCRNCRYLSMQITLVILLEKRNGFGDIS